MWTIGACLCVAAAGYCLFWQDREFQDDGWECEGGPIVLCGFALMLGAALYAVAYYNRSDVPDPNAWSVVVGERDPEERAAGVAVRVRPRVAAVTP